MLVTMLPSHAGDGAATQGCTGHGYAAPELRALRCCRIMKKLDIHVGS
jgi:hypothetical protein